MISPKDAEPIGAVWIEQLDRHNISPFLYERLMNRAVDVRAKALQNGENPPPLTVELLISEFRKLKEEVHWQTVSLKNTDRLEHDIQTAEHTVQDKNRQPSAWETEILRRTETATLEDALSAMKARLESRREQVNKILEDNFLEPELEPLKSNYRNPMTGQGFV